MKRNCNLTEMHRNLCCLAIVCIFLLIGACSKTSSNAENTSVNYAIIAQGSYTGYFTLKNGLHDGSIVITRKSDTVADLQINFKDSISYVLSNAVIRSGKEIAKPECVIISVPSVMSQLI